MSIEISPDRKLEVINRQLELYENTLYHIGLEVQLNKEVFEDKNQTKKAEDRAMKVLKAIKVLQEKKEKLEKELADGEGAVHTDLMVEEVEP